MGATPADDRLAPAPPSARRFRPRRFIAWLAGAVAAGASLAWLGHWVEPHFSPLWVFPALLGGALGLALVVLAQWTDAGHRRSILAGTAAAALTVALCQHYASFLANQTRARAAGAEAWQAARAFPELIGRAVPADGFADFMRRSAAAGRPFFGGTVRGAGLWLLWVLDAAITLAAALAVVAAALRRPYCDECGSWYRPTRRGRLDVAGAAVAAVICPAADFAPGTDCRLWHCRTACGPTGLELSWNQRAAPAAKWHWLDRDQRDRMTAVLDQSGGRSRPATERS